MYARAGKMAIVLRVAERGASWLMNRCITRAEKPSGWFGNLPDGIEIAPASITDPVGVALSGKSRTSHAVCLGRLNANDRVLDNQATGWEHLQLSGSLEKYIRRWFTG